MITRPSCYDRLPRSGTFGHDAIRCTYVQTMHSGESSVAHVLLKKQTSYILIIGDLKHRVTAHDIELPSVEVYILKPVIHNNRLK